MIQKIRPHPLEHEVDRIIESLGGSISTMKYTTDTGVLYNFNYGVDSEIGVYVGLPVYVSTRPENLFRIEFTIGEVAGDDVGKILVAMTLDMDLQRYTALRVIPRTKNHRNYQIVLGCVCSVDLVRAGFVSAMLIAGMELAEFYRAEFFISQRPAA